MGFPDQLHSHLPENIASFTTEILEPGERIIASTASKLGETNVFVPYASLSRSIYVSVTDRRVIFYFPTPWANRVRGVVDEKPLDQVSVDIDETIEIENLGRFKGVRYLTLSDTFPAERSQILQYLRDRTELSADDQGRGPSGILQPRKTFAEEWDRKALALVGDRKRGHRRTALYLASIAVLDLLAIVQMIARYPSFLAAYLAFVVLVGSVVAIVFRIHLYRRGDRLRAEQSVFSDAAHGS